MTTDKQLTVQAAAKDGHYQIVCRHQFAALNSWYITLTDVENWNWNVNEYRIFVGTREPPMINEMNDYSVYFCGYTYYFIDGDGEVKKVTNVNFTEFGEQYTSFLKCAKIQVDALYSNETGFIDVEDNLRLKKSLISNGTSVFEGDAEFNGIVRVNNSGFFKNLETSEGIKASGDSEFSSDVIVKGSVHSSSVSVDDKGSMPTLYVDNIGALTGDKVNIINNMTVPEVYASEMLKSKSLIITDTARIGNLLLDGAQVEGNISSDKLASVDIEASNEVKSKSLNVTDKANINNLDVSDSVNVGGTLKVTNDITAQNVEVYNTLKSKNVNVTDTADINSLNVSNNVNVMGNLEVTGTINGLVFRVV